MRNKHFLTIKIKAEFFFSKQIAHGLLKKNATPNFFFQTLRVATKTWARISLRFVCIQNKLKSLWKTKLNCTFHLTKSICSYIYN